MRKVSMMDMIESWSLVVGSKVKLYFFLVRFVKTKSNLDIELALFPFPLHVGEFPKILPISVRP